MVEPISVTVTAILAALTAGVATGAGKAGENLLTDAYGGLKAVLKRKFGNDSEVTKAVDNLEDKPDSPARQGQLAEEVEVAGADQDPDVRRAAQDLLDQIKAQPGGDAHIQNTQNAFGSGIAQAQDHSTATVNFHQPKE